MASADPGVFGLFNHPEVALLDPYELQRRKLAIANALAAQQLQQQQIQTGAIGLEQAQRDQAADAALRAAMGGGDPRAVRAGLPGPGVPAPAAAPPPTPASVLPGAAPGSAAWSPGLAAPALAPPAAGGDASTSGPGEMLASGGAPPAAAGSAPHELSDQEILGLMGAKGYGLITARNAAREKQAAYQKASGEVESHDRDYWGSLAYAVQHSGGDPGVLQATLSQAAADGKQNTPQFQAIAGALRSGDGARVQSLISQAIEASPEQQKLLNERTTAEAHKQTADIAGQKSNQELFTQKLATTGQLLGSTRDQRSWDDVMRRIDDPKVKAEFAQIPWSPDAPALARQKGLNPEQQVTTAETARRDTAAIANEQRARDQEQQNINLRVKAFNQQYGNPLEGASDQELQTARMRATGALPLPNPRTKGYDRAVALAAAVDTSGTFTQNAGTRFETIKNFKEKGDSDQLVQLATALEHLDRAKTNSAAMGTEPTIGTNMFPTQRRYRQDIYNLTDEVGKLIKAGVVPEHEGKRAIDNLMSAFQSNRDAGLDELRDLMGGKVSAKIQKFNTGTGLPLPAAEYFDAKTQERLKKAGFTSGIAWSEPAAAAPAPHGIPDLGSTFNGGRVLKVTPIK